MAITEVGAREDHEGVWHAVTDDASRSAVATALCGVEISYSASSGAWDVLHESVDTCLECHDMLEGEHRETGFTVENIGGVPAIRSRDDPPWM